MTNTPTRTGAKIFKEYFGLLPGQKLADFAKELKELPDVDFFAIRDGIADGSFSY